MAIDLTKPEEFKKLKIDDLIADAVERNDMKALEWLQTESNTMKSRTREDGSTYEVRKSIVEIRPKYLKMFLGYKTKGAAAKERAKQAKKDKAQRELDDKFAAAFAMLKKK